MVFNEDEMQCPKCQTVLDKPVKNETQYSFSSDFEKDSLIPLKIKVNVIKIKTCSACGTRVIVTEEHSYVKEMIKEKIENEKNDSETK